MKFLHLEIGAPFEFKGERYTKAGPFSAINTATGKDKAMMRSASIKPLGKGEKKPPQQRKAEWDIAVLRDAIDDYHRSCLDLINGPGAAETRAAMEAAYQKLLKRLAV